MTDGDFYGLIIIAGAIGFFLAILVICMLLVVIYEQGKDRGEASEQAGEIVGKQKTGRKTEEEGDDVTT